MKRPRIFLFITFVCCIIVILFTVLDFLCLHDIRRDYVSSYILEDQGVGQGTELPEWTETKGEWRILTLSYSLRVLFLIMIMILLLHYIKHQINTAVKSPSSTHSKTGS